MAALILSPHLDDAVLSCWHLLTQPGEVVVINVFAGAPERRGDVAWWDRYTGATDSRDRVRERIEEDRAALSLTGRAAVNLDLLDEQYRDSEQPLAPLTAELERLVSPGGRIYAPAALASHPDHALVRTAALGLRAKGCDVSLYADLPHATLHGWPAWVTRKRVSASHDLAAAIWEHSLAATGIPPETMAAAVHELDRSSHARKMEAVHTYRTQLEGLAELTGRGLADRELLGYEVVWALPGTATPAPTPARSDGAVRL
jgi:LmbE family N-acetylglucosaminyl deacetylase